MEQSTLTKGDLVDLTKEWILSRITQEEILEHYMGRALNFTTRFKSPLRKDKHPTCSLAYFGGRLYYRDWSKPNTMDVFSFVQSKHRLLYREALRHIADELNLWEVDPSLEPTYLNKNSENQKSRKKEIAVKIQDFTPQDIAYLKQYGLTSTQTSKFKVFSLKYIWVGGQSHYIRKAKDPALGYYFGSDEQGSQRWKIYFYRRRDDPKRPRFLGNTNRIAGWVQLPKTGSLLVLTKSLKDVMVLDLFGVTAISMQSETTMPYPYIIDELKERFKTIVSLYDFDYTGVVNAMRLRRTYGIQPLFLTDGRFGSIDFNAKDISDYFALEGPEETENLLYDAIQKLGLKPDTSWSWTQ